MPCKFFTFSIQTYSEPFFVPLYLHLSKPMFLLQRRALTLPVRRLKTSPYRNVHQKTTETAVYNKRYVLGIVGASGVGGGIIYYYLQREKQTYNSSSLNDNNDERFSPIIRSPREATAKLRENQISFLLQRNNGVWR